MENHEQFRKENPMKNTIKFLKYIPAQNYWKSVYRRRAQNTFQLILPCTSALLCFSDQLIPTVLIMKQNRSCRLYICPESYCRKGWGDGGGQSNGPSPPPPPHLFPHRSVVIQFKDDETVILLLRFSIMLYNAFPRHRLRLSMFPLFNSGFKMQLRNRSGTNFAWKYTVGIN